jgi:hypothetical protein
MSRLVRIASLIELGANRLPLSQRAKHTGPSTKMMADISDDASMGFESEELENGRPDIIIANMKISNDDQKV